ncbi:MAG: peptide chain release factor N(5)-glutamine methyltransferase [Clostridia bacterium]|nr:peptide chain release factor N(5)-glutamine methyltransferase [Clostridia bacterium]
MNEEQIRARLMVAGIENARFEAHQLLEALSGDALSAAVEKRCGGYPLQYILGEWDFYRETYEVSEDCLIPRADTELLVEKAIAMLPSGARLIDLCTGSGCVAISTLCARPDVSAVGVDLFEKTLALANRNAERNGVAERFTPMRADVLQEPPTELMRGSFQAIVSNPPYIRADVIPTLQKEVQYEPKAALNGGEDGLDFYRSILDKWMCLLAKNGFVLFEIGYDQGQALIELGEKKGMTVRVFADLGGNDRVVLMQK